jgi:hypothetical protein
MPDKEKEAIAAANKYQDVMEKDRAGIQTIVEYQ